MKSQFLQQKFYDAFSNCREDGHYSTEIQYIGMTIANACGCGFVFSSIVSSRRARDEFLEKNKLTVFSTRFKAAVSM